jgi:hypothetical protein
VLLWVYAAAVMPLSKKKLQIKSVFYSYGIAVVIEYVNRANWRILQTRVKLRVGLCAERYKRSKIGPVCGLEAKNISVKQIKFSLVHEQSIQSLNI